MLYSLARSITPPKNRGRELFDGCRTEDHRIIEVLFEDIDRYTKDFWEQAHERTGMIQHVPESNWILVKQGQETTPEQEQYFDMAEEVEEF